MSDNLVCNKEMPLSGFGKVSSNVIMRAVKKIHPPFYLYDESVIEQKCNAIKNMDLGPFNLEPRYAFKANSNMAIAQSIAMQGFNFDCSTLEEVLRLQMAGIPVRKVMLTSQQVPYGYDHETLKGMMKNGLKYNVCSLRQLELIAPFAGKNNIPLSIRIHPEKGGSGESLTRNTANKYSCFGVLLRDLSVALDYAYQKNVIFDSAHVHIGSGGDQIKWNDNIINELGIAARYFSNLKRISFGGGIKEGRMPGEQVADLDLLANIAKKALLSYKDKTGMEPVVEIEPGTYIVANSGYIVTEVVDKKSTGPDGYNFLILGGGCMTLNARSMCYGSQHPFYLVQKNGDILSTELKLDGCDPNGIIPVGTNCESGDGWSVEHSAEIDANGNPVLVEKIVPRVMGNPNIGDYFICGGAGAYCSSMSFSNYNSMLKVPELLLAKNGELYCIRKKESMEQLIANELGLSDFNPQLLN